MSENHLLEILSGRKAFAFEKNHDPQAFRDWALKNRELSWKIATIYLIVILGLKIYMKNRPKMTLRGPLVCWNIISAAFSIAASLRMWPYFYRILTTHGFEHSLCDDGLYVDEVTAIWSTLFMVSKVFDLIDTVFIILRKQNLIFLHLYHHASVVVFVFYSYPVWVGTGLYVALMNYTIHAIMYSYYMFRAMGYRLPKIVSVSITTMQILQMVVACSVAGFVYHRMAVLDLPCGNDTIFEKQRTFVVYFSYFVLFAHYFWKTYLVRPKKEIDSRQKAE